MGRDRSSHVPISHWLFSDPKIIPLSGLNASRAPGKDRIFLNANGDLESVHWSGTRIVNSARTRMLPPSANVFEDFLNLADAAPNKVLRFARRNGMLGLCAHRLPQWHVPRTVSGDGYVHFCESMRVGSHGFTESVDSWRMISRSAGAIVALAKGSLRAKLDKQEEWNHAIWLPKKLSKWGNEAKRHSKILSHKKPAESKLLEHMCFIASEWIRCSGVAPSLSSQGGKFCITFSLPEKGFTLFGVLAAQLAAVLASDQSLKLCAHCRTVVEAGRNIGRDKHTFCSDCRSAKKPALYATRAWRARRAEAIRQVGKGCPIDQVASRVGTSSAQVSKWASAKAASRLELDLLNDAEPATYG